MGAPTGIEKFSRQRPKPYASRNSGRRVTYEGVLLVELLRTAGVSIGRAALRGPTVTQVLRASAPDGFDAVFALAELDPISVDGRVLIADTQDGRPLAARDGPLRLVAPGDKYPVRWIRNVMSLRVVGTRPNSRE